MLSQNNKTSWRNPWFVGMVGVVVTAVLVNSVLVWHALHQRSTLVDHEYNTRDRKTDIETIDDIEAHHKLSWKTTIKLPQAVVRGTPAVFEINVTDRQGTPVSGKMEVVAYRAADADKDFMVPFNEVSSGNYQGFISFPLKGFWELHIRVKRGNDVFEVQSKKLLVEETP